MKGLRYRLVSYDGKQEMYIYCKEGLKLIEKFHKENQEHALHTATGMSLLMDLIYSQTYKEEKLRFKKTKKYVVTWPYTYEFVQELVLNMRVNRRIDKLISE